MSAKSSIKIKNLQKGFVNFGNVSKLIFNGLSLDIDIAANSPSVILSPRQSGKTELMKIAASLEIPSSGSIETIVEGKKDGINKKFIPQKPSSFPWLNVKENIEFSLAPTDKKDSQPQARIDYLVNLTGLEGYENHFCRNISTGFRFRVSMASALVSKPDLLFIDDVFALMDAETKEEVFMLIKTIAKEEKTLMLISTASITGAASLADRIYLLGNTPLSFIEKYEFSGTVVPDKINILSSKITSLKLNEFSL
jgi:ABC-type nitrate/sulfonate/bicarbonate transport system, ATPase component